MKKISSLLVLAAVILGFAISASTNESLKNDLAIVSARIYNAHDAEAI